MALERYRIGPRDHDVKRKPGEKPNRIDKTDGYMPANCRWSQSYARCHDTRPVTRSDGRHFESLSEAVRETPRSHAYGIHLVTRGLQKTCGGFGWRFDPPEGTAPWPAPISTTRN